MGASFGRLRCRRDATMSEMSDKIATIFNWLQLLLPLLASLTTLLVLGVTGWEGEWEERGCCSDKI